MAQLVVEMKQEIFFQKRTKQSISSKKSLALHLGLKIIELDDFISKQDEQRYSSLKKIPKKRGGFREVLNPTDETRKIQRSIKDKLLQNGKIINWPSYIYGSIRKTKDNKAKDYIAAAQVHCNSKTVLNIDIQDFFDNIHSDLIFNIFNNLFKYPEKTSKILSNICTYNGYLPQGGITSSHLASMVLFDIEPDIVRKLSYKNLRYTRYIDDITISSEIHDFDMSWVIEFIKNKLLEKNLFINQRKTKSASHSLNSVLVHGLRVNNKKPAANKLFTKYVKDGINDLYKLKCIPNSITNEGYRTFYNKISGRVSVLQKLDHPEATIFRRKLKRIRPLGSEKDLIITNYNIKKLLSRHSIDKEKIFYKTAYKKVIQRINVLARNFSDFAKNAKYTLKQIKPK